MALTDSEGASPFTMPVQPMYGYGNNGGLFGNNGDLSWLILLLLCGWGGGFGMGGFGMGGGMWPMMMGGMGGFGGWGMDYLYPWLNNSQHMSDGFRDQQLQTSIGGLQNAVTAGFGDVQLGIAGINQTICQTGNTISQQMYANEIANLNRSFAEQTANAQGFNGLNSGVADLRYTVATEACADRAAVGDALQAVTMQGVQNTNALMSTIRDGIQSIKDDLCADRLEAERRENANLRSELMYARGQASQVEQTAQLRASQATVANQLVSELRSCPIPSQPVYGNQPIFTCPTTGYGGCGCGNNIGGMAG